MTSWDTQIKWLIQDVPVDDMLVLVFKNSVKSKVQLTGIQKLYLGFHVGFVGLEDGFRVLCMNLRINGGKHLDAAFRSQADSDRSLPAFCHILNAGVGILLDFQHLFGGFDIKCAYISQLPVISGSDEKRCSKFLFQL